MNEIEVGEYVRTNKGRIAKLEDIDIEPNKKYYFFDETIYYSYGEAIDFLEEDKIEKHIRTHSKNIIDLIEVGDYVNGHKVVKVKSMIEGKFEVEAQAFLGEYFISYEDIKTIVTKEQFNSVMYKVGDIE